ncbi:MAG: AsnC family transcriptional regulator [Robiginitomaculum sp.]|nr:MAG: AsnC family transcriptional regulator [Robiginitomaculum sp.]
MDKIDQHIIRELQQNGRLTNNELASRVHLSPSPCLRRVRNLEQAGIIVGYAALIDQKAYGLPVTVFIRIKLELHNKEAVRVFEERLGEIDEILDCYLMAGDSDYLLRVIIANLEAYETFIREKIHPIPAISSIDTSFAYGTLKRNRAFAKVI